MKGRDKTKGDAGAWGDTWREICNPKKQRVNCMAYVLKKKNGKKVTKLTFLTFYVPEESKPCLGNGYFGYTN
jgi:hypothetical protein